VKIVKFLIKSKKRKNQNRKIEFDENQVALSESWKIDILNNQYIIFFCSKLGE
jgi:hypothetical protein